MASEITKFRELLHDWLANDMPSLAAALGDRIFPTRPPQNVSYPCCTYALRRTPSVAGMPVWQGMAEVVLYGTSHDAFDRLEDAIVQDVVANADAMLARLSDASTVKTILFTFAESEEGARDGLPGDGFTVFTRTLRFTCAIAKRDAAWD
jgi:hypothetical protein